MSSAKWEPFCLNHVDLSMIRLQGNIYNCYSVKIQMFLKAMFEQESQARLIIINHS